jgi:phosphatidylglycerophosphatase A
MTRLGVLLATGGGAGYAPIAPGTAGAAIGVLWHIAFRPLGAPIEVVALVILSIAGVWAAGVAASASGRKDPGHVVVDEIAGQALTLACLNTGFLGLLIGFGLFRLFDIFKPWPVRQFEALPGGLGIMADDLMAGVYGWIALQSLIVWFPEMF